MNPAWLAAAILTLTAAACARCGYAIKHQAKYQLIAGFDAARASNPKALARWVGNGAMLLAAVCAAGVVALLLAPGMVGMLAGIIGVSTAAIAITIFVGASSRARQGSNRAS